MSPSKNKNYTASVRLRLINYARSSSQDFVFVLQAFAKERLLYRLSRSPYVDNFVLKGRYFPSFGQEIFIVRHVTLMCLQLIQGSYDNNENHHYDALINFRNNVPCIRTQINGILEILSRK